VPFSRSAKAGRSSPGRVSNAFSLDLRRSNSGNDEPTATGRCPRWPSPLVALGRRCALVALVALSISCDRSTTHTINARPAAAPCPSSLVAVLPADARDRLVLRVQRIFANPRMAALVRAYVDDAGERAMMLRAERYGYDARTLDRAAIAWTVRGSTLFVGAGSFDGRVIAERLYDRLVGPRQRTTDPTRDARVTGELGAGPVALLVRPACSVVAYVEGREGALVDRVRSRALASATDPEPAVWWRTVRTLDPGVVPQGAALMTHVRAVEVRAEPQERGLEVEVLLEGSLPEDAEPTLRRVARELAETPLGELSGAVQWSSPQRLTVRRDESRGVRLSTVVPWGALEALASALAGRI
jgi:hypothetical protein